MEWDQISDKWVTMTRRLRNEGATGPRNTDPLASPGRTTRHGDRTLVDIMPSETPDVDRSLTKNE